MLAQEQTSSGEGGVARKPKLLVIELWGLGDLTMATTLIARALEAYEVVLLAKPHAVPLLKPAFPTLRFVEWHAPWTAFRG